MGRCSNFIALKEMQLIWMVITISEKTIHRKGHYLISRRLNRAVKILGIAL